MEPVFSENGESGFYYPHYVHDKKANPLSSSALATTHSDQLGMRLWQLLEDPGARAAFKEMETSILELKLAFYEQFKSRVRQEVS